MNEKRKSGIRFLVPKLVYQSPKRSECVTASIYPLEKAFMKTILFKNNMGNLLKVSNNIGTMADFV